MRVLRVLLSPIVAGACLGPPELPPRPEPLPPPRVLVAGGDSTRVGRRPRIGLRFQRALGAVPEDAARLLRGTPTSLADMVPSQVTRDLTDPAVLWVLPAQALQPDAPVALVLSPTLRALDGGRLTVPDAGPAAWTFALRVAPARDTGPVLSVAAPTGTLPGGLRTLWVRFDRPVFSSAPGRDLVLRDPQGVTLPARTNLGCEDPEGGHRCAWVQLLSAPAHGVQGSLQAPRLHSRRGVPVETSPWTFTVDSAQMPTRPDFAVPVVCDRDEESMGGMCVRPEGRWLVVRVMTDLPSVLRATLTAGVGEGEALGGLAWAHVLRVPVPSPGAAHALTLEVYGSDGARSARRVLWPVGTTLARPRVRIAEVVARPGGGSAQEYVELVNVEALPAWVGGWVLRSGSGRSVLPWDAVVPARGRALVVGPAFDPRGVPSVGAPAVAPGAALVRVRAALTAQGLRDSGADLVLEDPHGARVSFFPGADPALVPQAGVGVVRADPDLEEQDPAAWTYDEAGSCTPGAADRLR